jgi:hypothetical protein
LSLLAWIRSPVVIAIVKHNTSASASWLIRGPAFGGSAAFARIYRTRRQGARRRDATASRSSCGQPRFGTGDHHHSQHAMRGLDLVGSNDERRTALPHRPVWVRERDFDDVPNLKGRHRRAGQPQTTTHGKERRDRRPVPASLWSGSRGHPRSDKRSHRLPTRRAARTGCGIVVWALLVILLVIMTCPRVYAPSASATGFGTRKIEAVRHAAQRTGFRFRLPLVLRAQTVSLPAKLR